MDPTCRLGQVIDWLARGGQDGSGALIIFDECHRAKNLAPQDITKTTKTGLAVLHLQEKLPQAAVLYSSATGATEPNNLSYMTRLWGYQQTNELVELIKEPQNKMALELAAMSLKASGSYFARTLSYHGAEFQLSRVRVAHRFIAMYDRSTMFWTMLYRLMSILSAKGSNWRAQYWSAHQRFFRSMMVAAKVPYTAQLTRDAIAHGFSVVIGLQSTGEAAIDRVAVKKSERDEEDLDNAISAPMQILYYFIESNFPLSIPLDEELKESRCQSLTYQVWSLCNEFGELPKVSTLAEPNEGRDGGGGVEEAAVEAKYEPVAVAVVHGGYVPKREGREERRQEYRARALGRRGGVSVDAAERLTGADLDSNFHLTEEQRDEIYNQLPQREWLAAIRRLLLNAVEKALELPPNPLDELIDMCGGRDTVAELTGRKSYVETDERNGRAKIMKRANSSGNNKDLNLVEKSTFMNGSKRVAIISDAASTGISLQADRRCLSASRRRLHLTIELPWSADKAIQQFGRSHRANQQSVPRYQILVTQCGGEARFASAAAKRLQSLGALLRGDRRAVGAGSELMEFDVDSVAGAEALRVVLNSFTVASGAFSGTANFNFMVGVEVPVIPAHVNPDLAFQEEEYQAQHPGPRGGNRPPLDHPFFTHFTPRIAKLGILEAAFNNIGEQYYKPKVNKVSVFLNRLLGLPIAEQDLLFSYFASTLDAVVRRLKSEGKYDRGIVSLTGNEIQVLNREVVHHDATGGGTVERVEVKTIGGMSWEAAVQYLKEAKEKLSEVKWPGVAHLSGFYICNTVGRMRLGRHGSARYIMLVTEVADYASVQGLLDQVTVFVQTPYNKKKASGQRFVEFLDCANRAGSNLLDPTSIRNKYRMVTGDPETNAEAKRLWNAWYEHTAEGCIHGDGCTTRNCGMGTRFAYHHILMGAVLPHFKRINDLHTWCTSVDHVEKQINGMMHIVTEPIPIVRVVSEKKKMPAIPAVATTGTTAAVTTAADNSNVEVIAIDCDDVEEVGEQAGNEQHPQQGEEEETSVIVGLKAQNPEEMRYWISNLLVSAEELAEQRAALATTRRYDEVKAEMEMDEEAIAQHRSGFSARIAQHISQLTQRRNGGGGGRGGGGVKKNPKRKRDFV